MYRQLGLVFFRTAKGGRLVLLRGVHCTHDTGVLDSGKVVTYGLFKALLREEMGKIRELAAVENAGVMVHPLPDLRPGLAAMAVSRSII